MSTRFYMPSGGTVPTISPPFIATAGVSPAPIRCDMAITRQGTALTTHVSNIAGAYYTTSAQKTGRMFVGPPMSAQTISGNFSAVFKCCDVNSMDNGGGTIPPMTFIYIRVYSSANVLRGSLFNQAPLASENNANTDYGQKWAATLQTRTITARTLTSLAVLDGDRIVVMVGTTGDVGDTHDFSLVFGDPAVTADHTLSAGQTMVGVPWIEFSQDLFGAAGPVTLAASGTTAATATCSGDPTAVSSAQTLPATGTIVATTATTGNPARVLLVLPASGTAAAVSTTSGDATRTPLTLAVSGTTAATTSTTGDPTRVTLTLAASGTTPAVTGVTGDPTVVGATQLPAAAGTVTAVSSTTGNPTRVPLVLAASGTVDVIATTLGDATRQWVTFAASGTIAAVTFTSGAVYVTGTEPPAAPIVKDPILTVRSISDLALTITDSRLELL